MLAFFRNRWRELQKKSQNEMMKQVKEEASSPKLFQNMFCRGLFYYMTKTVTLDDTLLNE